MGLKDPKNKPIFFKVEVEFKVELIEVSLL